MSYIIVAVALSTVVPVQVVLRVYVFGAILKYVHVQGLDGTILVKCKLTVTQNFNNMDQFSIFKTLRLLVLSLNLRALSFVLSALSF